MKRYLRHTMCGLLPTALAVLVLGVPTAAPDLGLDLQDVNLACNDGTDLTLTLDLEGVTQLSSAVSAINLYPAGDPALACSLTQQTLPSPFRTFSSVSPTRTLSSSGGSKDFAVGGGQGIFSCAFGGRLNFSLSAHVPNDTPVTPGFAQPGAGGTFNVTVPQQPSCGFEQGTLVSKIDCVEVTGNHAEMTAVVTKATGSWAAGGIQPGDGLALSATDNSPLMPDSLQATPFSFSGGTGPCDFFPFPETPIDHGNINIHDAM